MAGRVEDKVAIVTGGASGIGRATVEALAAEGARVVVADVNEEQGREVEKSVGGDCVFVRHDVSDETSWRAIIETSLERFSRLDVLVNNAGIIVAADVEATSLEHWQRVMAVNAQGVFLGCKHAIPAMRRSGGGSIVNISSTAGLVGTPPYAAYSASKGAVRSFTKTVASHCVERGDAIRCNSVHPGGVDTPLVHALREAAGLSAEHVGAASQPGGAPFGEPRDIALLVLYLASDESRYMNGSELAIDGGLTAI